MIAEAKYNTAQLGNTKRSGRQMSDKWIETRQRLVNEVDKEKAKKILLEMIMNPNNFEKRLIKIKPDGTLVNSTLNEKGYIYK